MFAANICTQCRAIVIECLINFPAWRLVYTAVMMSPYFGIFVRVHRAEKIVVVCDDILDVGKLSATRKVIAPPIRFLR